MIRKQKKLINAYGLGFVLYMEKDCYKEDMQLNKDIHIKAEKSKVISELLEKYNLEVNYSIIGHEHGTDNNKCHYQIAFKTLKKYEQFEPSTINIDDQKYLIMCQASRNIYALIEYCKKDGDYFEANYAQNNNIYETILNSQNLSHDDIINKLKNDENNAEKLLFFGNNL